MRRTTHRLVSLIVTLALAVPAVLLAPAHRAKWIALGVTTVELLLSLGLWWGVDTRSGLMQLVSSVPWIPGWGVHYALGIDGISLTMVLLTTLLMPLCVLGGWTQM